MPRETHTYETPSAGEAPPRDAVREREVIVTGGSEPRSPVAGLILGLVAVAIVIVIALVGFGILGDITGGNGDAPSIDVPDEVDVNVDDGDAPNPGSS